MLDLRTLSSNDSEVMTVHTWSYQPTKRALLTGMAGRGWRIRHQQHNEQQTADDEKHTPRPIQNKAFHR